MHVRSSNRTSQAVFSAVVSLAIAACQIPRSDQFTGRAADEWIRTYTLAPGGEVQIGNTNGPVDVKASDDSTVEVRAERIATATTETSARELLPRIGIVEDIKPDKIWVRTTGIDGILIGAAFEVRYQVRAPRSAMLRLRTTNGHIDVQGFSGRVIASTINGGIVAAGLSGGVEVRSTNGNTQVELASVGSDLIDLRSTNGHVRLTIPETSNANLLATVNNGKIDLTGLPFQPMGEQTRRRVRGRINQGGTPIELATTNGNVRLGPVGGDLAPASGALERGARSSQGGARNEQARKP